MAEKECASLETALNIIPAKIKVPDFNISGIPTGIFILGAPRLIQKRLYLDFANGMEIAIEPNALLDLSNAKSEIDAQFEKLDTYEKVIDLDGVRAKAREPFDQDLGSGGVESGMWPVISYIMWYEGGTHYVIYGNKIPLSTRQRVKDLLPIAYSIRRSVLR